MEICELGLSYLGVLWGRVGGRRSVWPQVWSWGRSPSPAPFPGNTSRPACGPPPHTSWCTVPETTKQHFNKEKTYPIQTLFRYKGHNASNENTAQCPGTKQKYDCTTIRTWDFSQCCSNGALTQKNAKQAFTVQLQAGNSFYLSNPRGRPTTSAAVHNTLVSLRQNHNILTATQIEPLCNTQIKQIHTKNICFFRSTITFVFRNVAMLSSSREGLFYNKIELNLATWHGPHIYPITYHLF